MKLKEIKYELKLITNNRYIDFIVILFSCSIGVIVGNLIYNIFF
jgi:hypothetical protein